MTPEKLAKIKQYQKDYENRFGETLEIDWHTMKGLPKNIPTVDELFKKVCAKHGASEEAILSREKRSHSEGMRRERAALAEFSREVLHLRLNTVEAANKIKRDRQVIYYYAFKKV